MQYRMLSPDTCYITTQKKFYYTYANELLMHFKLNLTESENTENVPLLYGKV